MISKSSAFAGAALMLVTMAVAGSAVRYYYSTTVVVQLGTLKNELEAKLVENAHLAAAKEQLEAQAGYSQNHADQLSRENKALQTELAAAQSQIKSLTRAPATAQTKEIQEPRDPKDLKPLPTNGPGAKARWESARSKPLALVDLERRMRAPPIAKLRLKHLFEPQLCEWDQESWEFEIYPRFGCPRDNCPETLQSVLKAASNYWQQAYLNWNGDKSWLESTYLGDRVACPWRDFLIYLWIFDDGSAGAFVMPDTAGAIMCTTRDAFGIPAEGNAAQTAIAQMWEQINFGPSLNARPPGLSYSTLGITISLAAKDPWPDKAADPTVLKRASKDDPFREMFPLETRERRKFKATLP
jgi:hypothetical protein